MSVRDRDIFGMTQSKDEQLVNQLDPELDLRNINFATGENKYINEKYDDFTIDY